MKIVPGYAQVTHIIEGGRRDEPGQANSTNGTTLAPELNPVDFNNPMDFPARVTPNFQGDSDAERNRANLTQAMGLDSGDGRLGQSMISMSEACNCYDEEAKGTDLSYGNPNTGRQS